MRRTPLKRSTPLRAGKGMKRVKGMRKASKASISKVQRELWELCKQITRKKYGNSCFTCSRAGLEGSNWHTGHLIPKASLGAFLKYDLRVLRPQCYHCNINLGGNGAVFIERLRKEEGDAHVDRILEDRQVSVQAYDHYLERIAEYKAALEALTKI